MSLEETAMKGKELWEKIREWHRRERVRELEAAFELGDLIVLACIRLSLTEADVIRRIMEDMGEESFGQTSYNRAARIARKFSRKQRLVLVERGVSLGRVEVLASRAYEGERRHRTIAKIKAGEIVAPWKQIRGVREEIHLERTKTLRMGLRRPDDVIALQIREGGQYQASLMYDGLRALVSQVPQGDLVEEMNRAIADRRKAGMNLREIRMAS